MSNEENDKLLERAHELIDVWEGTLTAEILRADIRRNDLEALQGHIGALEAVQRGLDEA